MCNLGNVKNNFRLYLEVPYRLSTDAQITNKLSVETLFATIYG